MPLHHRAKAAIVDSEGTAAIVDPPTEAAVQALLGELSGAVTPPPPPPLDAGAAADEPARFPAIGNGHIGSALVPTVNARDLHGFLGVGKDFSTWIKERIGAYGFNENSDFVIVEAGPQNRGAGNRGARTDYHLTLDMAKELGMVDLTKRSSSVVTIP